MGEKGSFRKKNGLGTYEKTEVECTGKSSLIRPLVREEELRGRSERELPGCERSEGKVEWSGMKGVRVETTEEE